MQAGADYPEAVDIAMSGAGLEEVPHAVMGIVTSPSVAEVKEEDVGSQLLVQEQFEKAAEKFTIAISAGRVTSELLTKRAWAFISCGRYMDALRDADQAISLDSSNYQAHAHKGFALCMLAKECFQEGLRQDPCGKAMKQNIQRCCSTLNQICIDSDDACNRESSQEFDCPLCMRLLYEPMTTPCGHTFCSECLQRALDHNQGCPVCRKQLPDSAFTISINFTLRSILMRNFPDDYMARKEEVQRALSIHCSGLPICLMYAAVPFPGVTIAIEVDQPAYKLMMRRSGQTNSLFGLVPVTRSEHPQVQQPGRVGCELQITRVTHNGSKMILEVKGRRRFMLERADVFDGYLLGRVTYFDDFAVPNACAQAMLEARAREARELLYQLSQVLQRSECPVARRMLIAVLENVPEDLHALTFHLAGKLPVPMDVKMQFLEVRCPLMRMEALLVHLRQFTQKLWCSH